MHVYSATLQIISVFLEKSSWFVPTKLQADVQNVTNYVSITKFNDRDQVIPARPVDLQNHLRLICNPILSP